MHQPNDEPRKSVYYRYQVFPPYLPRETEARQKVVIVGAGPVGMTLALLLARYRVPSVILDSEVQVSEGSRAIVYTRRSMEILQQAGVARRIAEIGLPWRFGNSYYRGQRVFRMEAPHDEDSRFYPMINLQQQYLEEFLLEEVCRSGLVEVRWGNRLIGLSQCDDGVEARIDTQLGEYTLSTDWLVAADGARSSVRSLLGLSLVGDSYTGRFVIADIKIDLDLPTERLAFFDPEWNPGNTVLMHRQPFGIWRIDFRLPEGEEPQEALRFEILKARIDAHLEMIGYEGKSWELDWCSVYSARALTLENYVHGHVVFAGDAAHVLPIFGVRGANTGFQDAFDLAWKLAFTLHGWSGRSLLASYSEERVGAAKEIIEEAGRSTRFMTPPTTGHRTMRDAVLSLSLKNGFVGPLFHWRTSRPHVYAHSRLNARDDDQALFLEGPVDGAPIPNVKLGLDDFLLDHWDESIHLLVFTEREALPADVTALQQRLRARGVPLRLLAISLGRDHVEGADLTLPDPEGRCWRKYGASVDGATYLVRPDQHVAARWGNCAVHRIAPALERLVNRLGESA